MCSGCFRSGAIVPMSQRLRAAADYQPGVSDARALAKMAWKTIEHPGVGTFRMPTWPVRASGKPPKVTPAPLLGQHTADVLGDWLGMDSTATAGLKQAGVV